MGDMSILDDAIREHLELKRAHGADEAELKRLEHEAFGPAERPDQAGEQIDPFAEAPTEFLASPDTASAESDPGGRRINVADLQEPPPPGKPAEPEGGAESGEPEDEAETAAPEAPGEPEGPAEEEHPAMEHKTIAQPAQEDKPAPPSDALQPDPEAPHGDAPSEERQSVAEQPTEFFDVEQQFEDTSDPASPSDEQLIDAEGSEPRMAPVEPIQDDEPEDEFDDFFSEQRLSDELNQALEAPLPDEPGAPITDESTSPFLDPDAELGPTPEGFDEDLPEDSREHELPEDSGEGDLPDEPGDEADAADEYKPHEPGHADALEDTPEFLEESPEDEDAWFEQRPPKDFDFGD
jgi:hypothetical protein